MTIPELAKYFTTIWTQTVVPTISNLAKKDKENADSIVKAVSNIYIPKEVSVDNFPSIEPLLEAQNATTEAVKSIPETKVDLTGVTKQLADIVSAVKAQETVVNLTEKEVDTQGIVSAITKLEQAIKALPAPEKQQFIDYSDSLKALRTALETRKSPDLTKIEGLLGTLANTKDIQVVVDTLGELIGKEETVYPFKFDDDGNLLTAPNRWGGGGVISSGGGGVVDSVKVKNASGTEINPATSEKQDSIVSAIQNITIPAPTGGATEENQDSLQDTMNQILSAIRSLAAARGIASDIRVTLLGGTTAVTGSLTSAGTVSTVSTVTTLSNITSVGGLSATPLMQNQQNVVAVLSNVNNVS